MYKNQHPSNARLFGIACNVANSGVQLRHRQPETVAHRITFHRSYPHIIVQTGKGKPKTKKPGRTTVVMARPSPYPASNSA